MKTMKKLYFKPTSTLVRIHLFGSVLDGGTGLQVNPASNTTDSFTTREQKSVRFDWDDENEE